jgi:hypothetical protein
MIIRNGKIFARYSQAALFSYKSRNLNPCLFPDPERHSEASAEESRDTSLHHSNTPIFSSYQFPLLFTIQDLTPPLASKGGLGGIFDLACGSGFQPRSNCIL